MARRTIWTLGLVLALCAAARGVTITVDTTADEIAGGDGVTSLREAVLAANLLGGQDTILLPSGLLHLTRAGSNEDFAATGDLDITDPLVVIGSTEGPSTIDASALTDRVFHVHAGASLTVSNLNITGASVGDLGGAILNAGGELRLAGCAVYSNRALAGGAIFNAAGTTTVFQSTLAYDTSALQGGAVRCATGSVIVQHSTVAGNNSTASSGGGLSSATGAVISLAHSLVAENTAFMDGPDLDGAFNSLGYNVVALTNGCVMTNVLEGNITGVAAPLAALRNNGGTTLTRATVPGNPAIDGGDPGFAPPPDVDQRGLARVFNGRVDIGAYEFQFTNLVVTTTNDELNFLNDTLSLREAVVIANLLGTVSNNITLGAGTYTLTIAGAGEDNALTGDLDLHSTVAVVGMGATNTILDANALDRFCFVDTGAQVSFQDVTIQGGLASVGGGLYNQGVLVLDRCIVVDNVAYVYGGGVEQYSGVLQVLGSTFAGNGAGSPGGGAIDVVDGVVELVNSTLADNYSPAGAGIFRESGDVQLILTTVAGNTASTTAGGIYSSPGAGSVYLVSSLIGDNASPGNPDIGGAISSQGYNLVEDDSGSAGYLETDQTGLDPRLDAMAFNGGPTPTYALLSDSPAINRADPLTSTNIFPYDQRGPGFPRKRGIRADVGAYEYPNPDDDGDGMPDEWEMLYGLNPTNAADAMMDDDGDTVWNIDEYRADTVPTNDLSFHSVVAIDQAAGLKYVTFRSSTNRIYQLQGATSLLQNDWTNISSSVTGQTGSTTLADDEEFSLRHYRVSVRVP